MGEESGDAKREGDGRRRWSVLIYVLEYIRRISLSPSPGTISFAAVQHTPLCLTERICTSLSFSLSTLPLFLTSRSACFTGGTREMMSELLSM